jgi:hypothetical protein
MEATPTNKRYSGRVFDAAALDQVRGILRAHAGASRQQLSYRVCEALNWRKADGSLKDMSCRVALLRLYREGLIELPAPRRQFEPLRSYARRTAQGEPGARIEAPLSALGTVRLEPVERAGSALWNELIDRYHYLGYSFSEKYSELMVYALITYASVRYISKRERTSFLALSKNDMVSCTFSFSDSKVGK